jgi:hypothetical protein
MIPMVAFNSTSFDTYGEIPTFLAPFFGYVAFMVVVLIAAKAIQYAIYGLMRFKTNLHYMDNGKAVVHVLLGLFIPLYQSFFYFSMRNRIPIDLPPVPQAYPLAPPVNSPQPPTYNPPQPPMQPNP